MNLGRLSKLIWAGFWLALVVCLISLSMNRYYGTQVSSATNQRHQAIVGISEMAALNRELTQLARLYANTGDQKFRRVYYQKWREGQTIKEIAMKLQKIGLSPAETLLLNSAEAMDLKQTGIEQSSLVQQKRQLSVSLLADTNYINSEWEFANALNDLKTSITQRLDVKFEEARNKAQLAMALSAVMQLVTLIASLLVFFVIVRRQLIVPLGTLSTRIRNLNTGEYFEKQERYQGLVEVVALAETFDAYADVQEELHRQHWVKGRLGELLHALQLCSSYVTFESTLQKRLADCLGCKAHLQFDTASTDVGAAEVHFSLPLFQAGQQRTSLELYFRSRPNAAQVELIDSLPGCVSTVLNLLQQRLHNQQLLQNARQQARQLEIQARSLQQRQDTLEATESWYKGIIEFAPKALLVFDEDSVILANQESETIFGFSADGLIGQSHRVLIPDSQLALVTSAIERLRMTNKRETLEVLARRANGSEFPAELRLCLLPARQGQGRLCAAIRDLSEHQANERRLKDAHEQLQAIVTAAPYGIAMVQGGVIVLNNSRLDELLGYETGEQLQRSPLGWLDLAEWAEEIIALEVEVRATLSRGDIYRQQLRLCRKDHTDFWASLSARAIFPEDLSRGSIWIIENVSAQHAAAAEMRQARQLAEDSARIKAEFLANMSHEIRTPMNAVIGLTHLILGTELCIKQHDYVSKLQNSSRHLLGVLDDILDFSKIDAGKLQLEAYDFSVAQLIEEVIDQVRPRVADKNLDLILNIHADVPACLHGDPLRLHQILLNYISNAVKFTEQGQIRVEAAVLKNEADAVLLHFSVADSGIGLSPEQVAHMFKSFQQSDSSISRRFGGTGLGLAIAKQLAELMDGTVGVHSVEGEGSEFWFEVRLLLPRHNDVEFFPVVTSLKEWKVPENTRVLVVEDNELNQQVAAELLQAVNCKVDIAADGRQALSCLSRHHYDLVFMDMQMPVLDGLAATRLLRLQPGMKSLPVVAMTANARQSDHDACIAAGMNDFISKPFDPSTLYAVLHRWVVERPITPNRVLQHALNTTSMAKGIHMSLDGVDMEAGLRRVLGRQELYVAMLKRYLKEQSSLVDDLSSALAAADLKKAEILAHNCKGVSATIGADHIAQIADAMEQAIREQKPDNELKAHLAHLREPLIALLKQLAAQLRTEVDTLPISADVQKLKSAYRHLDDLLSDCDAQAVMYFSTNTGLFKSLLGADYLGFETAMACFDFKKAQDYLRDVSVSI
jgi:PAS domain S-box-containing protein